MKTIKIVFEVRTPVTEVFAALTDPKKVEEWSGQKAVVQAKVDGRFSFFDDWATGKVLEYEPGKVFTHTWRAAEWPKTWADSTVRYTFSPTKSGTKITLKHKGLPNEEEAKNHRQGWYDYVLGPLKEYLSRA